MTSPPAEGAARRVVIVLDTGDEPSLEALLEEGAAVVMVTSDPGRWARFARGLEPTAPFAILAGEPERAEALEAATEMAKELFRASSVEVAGSR